MSCTSTLLSRSSATNNRVRRIFYSSSSSSSSSMSISRSTGRIRIKARRKAGMSTSTNTNTNTTSAVSSFPLLDMYHNQLQSRHHSSSSSFQRHVSAASASPSSSSSPPSPPPPPSSGHDSNDITTTTATTTTRTTPPPPPTPKTLPTLDISPMLDPTLYIKKSSKSNHTKCGSEASKRLLKAQNKIRHWIWNYDDYDYEHSYHTADSADDAATDAATDADSGIGTDSKEFAFGFGEGEKSLNFGLVGHGVPVQLLQDHVDVAWELLNQYSGSGNGNVAGSSSSGSSNDSGSADKIVSKTASSSGTGEVVECCFDNSRGELNMDWMKIRNRNGENYKIPYPLNTGTTSSSSTQNLDTIHHSINLYLTVMARLSTTFGTILQTSPLQQQQQQQHFHPHEYDHNEHDHDQSQNTRESSSSSSSNSLSDDTITNTNYWKHDKHLPINYWRTSIRRGFVYPPSATMFSTAFLVDTDTSSSTTSTGGDSGSGSSSRKGSNGSSSSSIDISSKNGSKVSGSKSSSSSDSSTSISTSSPNRGGRRSVYYEWTNPPIIELIPGCGEIRAPPLVSPSSVSSSNSVQVPEQDHGSDLPLLSLNKSSSASDNSSSVDSTSIGPTIVRGPSFVRVTIQGIPSSFWKGKDTNSCNDRGDMVPVSLVFEGCFQEGGN